MGAGSSKEKSGYGDEYESWLNERLNHYFNDIDVNILTEKLTQEEIDDLHAAVESILISILKEVAFMDKRFSTRKRGVVRVGSFYERSNIVAVDKFEFYIAISELSNDDIIQPVAVKKSNHDLFKVYVKNKITVERWMNCLIAESNDKYCLKGDIGLLPMFYNLVDEAVTKLRTSSRDRLYRTYGRFEIAEGEALSKHGATLRLKCLWNKEMVVHMTLTPAMFVGYEQVVRESDTLNEVIYKAVQRTGSILLVPEPDTDDCFRPSFVEVETHLMLDVLSRSHIKVFKILKFFVNGYASDDPENIEVFNIDAIRTLIITHEQICYRNDRMADCVMAVISYMQNLMTSPNYKRGLFLPSIFNKRVNVFKQHAANPSEDVWKFNKSALDNISEHLVNDVGSAKKYDFTKTVRFLIPIRESVRNDDFLTKTSMEIRRGQEADIPSNETLEF